MLLSTGSKRVKNDLTTEQQQRYLKLENRSLMKRDLNYEKEHEHIQEDVQMYEEHQMRLFLLPPLLSKPLARLIKKIRLTDWISLHSKELSRLFSNTH